jgi:hypothetical protein
LELWILLESGEEEFFFCQQNKLLRVTKKRKTEWKKERESRERGNTFLSIKVGEEANKLVKDGEKDRNKIWRETNRGYKERQR